MSLLAPGAVPGRPYWWDDVRWPSLAEAPPERVDLLVVGAGYTGLSAALAAHDAGASVAVIDSGKPGEGASSRNGGMVGAHPRLGRDILATRYDPETADALLAEAGAALGWFKQFVKREHVACDLQECGRIQLAYTGRHFEAQKTLATQLAAANVPCRVVPAAELGSEVRTALYRGGLIFPDHAGMHPARCLLGLLDAALRRSIPVSSDCPAVSLARVAGGYRVTTPLGTIVADKVVLATNGYTGHQFDWFQRRVFPLPSYIIATEPLPAEQIARLAPGRRMMVETRSRHCYFRISPDGSRILFGGRASMMDIDMAKAARRLLAFMGEIWPELRDTRLSHIWTGNTGFTFANMPNVGARGGVHYALGYCGGGTVLAPWLGRKAALQALGLPEGDTAYSRTRLEARWYHRGGRPYFLRAADLWYRHWVDRQERRAIGR